MTAALIVAVILGLVVSKSYRTVSAWNAFVDGEPRKAIIPDPAPESCTIFTASYGDTVLFRNNEDWINPNTYYWSVPPTGGDYGAGGQS